MSLVKSPMTPKRLAANRANALKSTGPRTARGIAQSRLNGLVATCDARRIKDEGRAEKGENLNNPFLTTGAVKRLKTKEEF